MSLNPKDNSEIDSTIEKDLECLSKKDAETNPQDEAEPEGVYRFAEEDPYELNAALKTDSEPSSKENSSEPRSVIYTDEEEVREEKLTYFDYHDAMIQIEMLFQSHILSFGYKEYSLETYVDRKFFSSWRAREGCADTDEMRAGLNIDGILRSDDPSESEVLTYLQYTLDIAELCRRSFNKEEAPGYDFDIRNYTELLSRIREILKRLGYEVRYVPEKEFIFLVPYDPAAEAASANEADPVSSAIVEYRSTSSLGHLDRKRTLLMELASSIESYADNLRSENSVLYNHIEFMLNHLSIRHDNSDGEDRIERVAGMTGEEMEAWYDETYQMMLLRILQHENKDRIARIDNLAEECGSAISSISEEEMTRILNGEFDDPENAPFTPEEPQASPASRTSTYARSDPETQKEPERTERPASNKKQTNAVRNTVIAIIIADLLFVMGILIYLALWKGLF